MRPIFTEVTSNAGFVFHGKLVEEGVTGIDELLSRLAAEPLDRTFEDERFGNFAYADEDVADVVCFFGNFKHYSHVFNIRSNDPSLIEALTTAIRANQQRHDYLSQPVYAEVEAERAALEDERRRNRQEHDARQARIILGIEL